MQSTAWTNGPYQHSGTHTHTSQAPGPVTRYVTRNPQANNQWQRMAANTVQPTQIATSHFGAYSNRQTANCQFSAGPHQAVSSQQKPVNYYTGCSTINTQDGNPTVPGNLGFQQASHQNSAQNVSTHSPHQIMMLNTMHPQQGASTYRNQSAGLHGRISNRMQDGNASSPRHCRNILFQNSNRPATQLPPAAPSPPDGKTIYAATEPNSQHVFAPKHHNTAISQSFTTNSSQTGQTLHVSSQKPQQYLTHYSTGDSTSTCSINSNSSSRSYETNLSSSNTHTDVERQQKVAKIVDYLYDGSDGHPPVNNSLPHKKANFIQDVSTANQNKQPVTMTAGKILNSTAPLSLLPSYGQSLLKSIHDRVYVPPQEGSASYVTATCDGSGNQAVKLSDTSSHSSPGRARAVAVVQPLSQESYQNANKEGTANKCSNIIKIMMEKYNSTPKNKPVNNLTPRPNLNPNRLSSSDSAGCCRDLSQKQCATEATTAMQVNQHVAPAAQQSATSKVPVSQSDCQDNSKTPLSSTPWSYATLNMLIKDLEKAQMELNDSTSCNIIKKLISMFWKDTDVKSNLKMYTSIMIDAKEFCKEHLKPASVILSQVKDCFDEEGYHVLEDSEVYLERPYKSTWLNTDEGLDDIDKDFPLCLQHRLHTLQRDRHQVKTDSSMVKQSVNEDINKLSSTELDSSEDKQDSSVEATQTTPTKTKYDPYSFQIQVMSPESAKVIYRQTQIELPQSRDTDNQAGSVTNSSVVGEPPKVTDDIICGSEAEDNSFCPIEEVCCIARWKEILCGSVSSTKCQCKDLQSIRDTPDETSEMVAGRQEDEIRLNSQFYAITEEGSLVMDGETTGTLCWAEHYSDSSDIPMDDDKPHSSSDKDLNHSLTSINSSKSSILLISDDDDHQAWTKSVSAKTKDISDTDAEVECVKDCVNSTASTSSCVSSDKIVENLPSIETEVVSQKLDPGVNDGQAQLPSTNVSETFQSYSSFETEDQAGVSAPDARQTNLSLTLIKRKFAACESEVANQKSNLDGNCGQAQGTSTIGTEWLLESEEQDRVSAPSSRQSTWSVECSKRKRKRQHSCDRFYPIFKKSLVDTDSQSKREQVLSCDTDIEPPASSAQTVELVLFGSTTKDKCAVDSRKRHKTFPGADAVSKPPKVLNVNLSPVKRKPNKTLLNWDYSVEQLYKKWRIRLPKAQKTQKCNVDSNGPANAEESPVSSETPLKRTPILIRLECGKQKRRRKKKKTKNVVTLKKPADEPGNNAENVGQAVTSLQNNVLNFSVLPSFFDFKDGSNKKMKTSDPLPDTPGLFERKNRKRERGSWCPDPEEKRLLLPPSTKTFQEFQKEYKKRRQQCTNE